MYLDLKLSEEERFLIDIFFSEKKIDNKKFNTINYDYIVKHASSHLMLPSLYINLKRKKYLKKIPKELIVYLNQIYELNYNRNRKLLKEVKEISKILNSNKIDYVFIKGVANILNGLYYDIGERMVGDIDILVNEQQAYFVYKLFQKLNYHSETKQHFFLNNINHFNRQINVNKTFAVEVHKKILDKYDIKSINQDKILRDKIKINGVKVPSKNFELLINVYNYQINDRGSMKLSYSYRNLYDSFLMIKKEKQYLENIEIDRHIRKYLMILNELKILNYRAKNYKIKYFDLLRFRIKKRNKFYSKYDDIFCNCYKKLKWRPMQIKELYKDREFRKYVLKKLISK